MAPPPEASPAAVSPPRWRIALWGLGTAAGATSVMIYLMASTFFAPDVMAARPLPLVLGAATCAAVAAWIAWRPGGVVSTGLRSALATGAVLAAFGAAGLGGYVLVLSQQLTPAPEAPQIGEVGPDFELETRYGRPWRLSSLRPQPVLLVFYRGHW